MLLNHCHFHIISSIFSVFLIFLRLFKIFTGIAVIRIEVNFAHSFKNIFINIILLPQKSNKLMKMHYRNVQFAVLG